MRGFDDQFDKAVQHAEATRLAAEAASAERKAASQKALWEEQQRRGRVRAATLAYAARLTAEGFPTERMKAYISGPRPLRGYAKMIRKAPVRGWTIARRTSMSIHDVVHE